MKKTFPILLFILVLLFLGVPPLIYAQVQTRLRIFEASNVGTAIDSSLRDMSDQFKSLLSFSSYRLLKEETVVLRPAQPALIPLHAGRSMELLLTGQNRNVAEVRVKIKREQTDVLDTKVRLSPGRTVSIGGPKHGQGVIIITLSAQF